MAARPFPSVSAKVHIAVLGPVEINGTVRAFRRLAARDLVVYLACHRRGVRTAQWVEAVWPGRRVSPSTVHSTVSDARRAIGSDGAGHPKIVRQAGLLRLDDSVVTDVEEFADLAADGDPLVGMRALEMVRGVPLSGLRGGDWAVFDGTQARVEALVVEAALTTAERLVAAGDPGSAELAVRQALIACPYDERLYRSLLGAVAAQGNRVRLRATMTQLRVLTGEPSGGQSRNPLSDLTDRFDPETTALYQDLLHGLPAVGAHPARL